jgi:hypothetical protein
VVPAGIVISTPLRVPFISLEDSLFNVKVITPLLYLTSTSTLPTI